MSRYSDAILNARKEYIKLNLQQKEELRKIYMQLASELSEEILEWPESRTRTHLEEMYHVVNKYLKELYFDLEDHTTKYINKAADIQTNVQLSFVDMLKLEPSIDNSLRRSITLISSRTVKQLIAGEYYKDDMTLSKRLWKITKNNKKNIDTVIKVNVARGCNARTLANELEKYINPNNRVVAKSFAAGIDSHKISYQAQRLARTSITHAMSEVQIQNAIVNPFNKGLRWNLSPNHSARMHGKTDECDDREGKVYKPEEMPLQHPNCLCYFTEELEDIHKCIKDINAWVNGASNPDIDKWVYAYKNR